MIVRPIQISDFFMFPLKKRAIELGYTENFQTAKDPKSILLGTSDISHDYPMIVPVYRHVLMFPAAGSGCSSHGVQPDSCRGALSSCRTSPKITGWFLLCRNNQDFNGHQWTKQTKITRYSVWLGSIMALIMIYYDSYGY